MKHDYYSRYFGEDAFKKLTGNKEIRDKVFLVSKVHPEHADHSGTIRACENSLRRLNTDYLDLYHLLPTRLLISISFSIR